MSCTTTFVVVPQLNSLLLSVDTEDTSNSEIAEAVSKKLHTTASEIMMMPSGTDAPLRVMLSPKGMQDIESVVKKRQLKQVQILLSCTALLSVALMLGLYLGTDYIAIMLLFFVPSDQGLLIAFDYVPPYLNTVTGVVCLQVICIALTCIDKREKSLLKMMFSFAAIMLQGMFCCSIVEWFGVDHGSCVIHMFIFCVSVSCFAAAAYIAKEDISDLHIVGNRFSLRFGLLFVIFYYFYSSFYFSCSLFLTFVATGHVIIRFTSMYCMLQLVSDPAVAAVLFFYPIPFLIPLLGLPRPIRSLLVLLGCEM